MLRVLLPCPAGRRIQTDQGARLGRVRPAGQSRLEGVEEDPQKVRQVGKERAGPRG